MKKFYFVSTLFVALGLSLYTLGQERAVTTFMLNENGIAKQEIPATGGNRDAGYQVDDGSIEGMQAKSTPGDYMWMNVFDVIPGAEFINSISLTWSETWGSPNNIPIGTLTRLILYEDPNDDGNPSDAVYLTEATTNVTHYGFPVTTVTIPTTYVSGKFFVAALIQNIPAPSLRCASLDINNMGAGWLCTEDVLGAFNVNNLMLNTLPPSPFTFNYIIRAYGVATGPTPAVPLSDYGIFAVVVLGFFYFVFRYRKLKKKSTIA